jgi:hypothetical protein
MLVNRRDDRAGRPLRQECGGEQFRELARHSIGGSGGSRAGMNARYPLDC